MASVGRGRGRGRGLAFRPPNEIKPGNFGIAPNTAVTPESKSSINGTVPKGPQVAQSKQVCEPKAQPKQNDPKNEIQCVENAFRMMSMMSEEDVLHNIPAQFQYLKTEDAFIVFMRELMNKCFQEPDFATTAAKLCTTIWNNPNLQPIFKKPLLSTTQQNYTKRSELRQKRNDSFYGLSIFLCEIYKHVKSKGQRMNPLLPYVCAILKELIKSDEKETTSDDALYFYQEMESVGKIIQETNKDELDEIMNTVRLKIISGDIKPSVRCRLIQLIELAACDWSLRNEVNSYYEDLQQDLIVEGR